MNNITEFYVLLLKYFNDDRDKANIWLLTPNYLWGYFCPITLVLQKDDRVENWIKKQLGV